MDRSSIERIELLLQNPDQARAFVTKLVNHLSPTRRTGDDWESAFILGSELAHYLSARARTQISRQVEELFESAEDNVRIVAFLSGIGDLKTDVNADNLAKEFPPLSEHHDLIKAVQIGDFYTVAHRVEGFFESHFRYSEFNGFDRYAFSALAQLGQAIIDHRETTFPLGGYIVHKFARRALGISPNNTMAWSHAARTLWASDYLEQSETFYWEALRRNPDNSYFYGELSDLIFDNYPDRRTESYNILMKAELCCGWVPHISSRIAKHLISSSRKEDWQRGLERLTNLALRHQEDRVSLELLSRLTESSRWFEYRLEEIFASISTDQDILLKFSDYQIGKSSYFAYRFIKFCLDRKFLHPKYKRRYLESLNFWWQALPAEMIKNILEVIEPVDVWAVGLIGDLVEKARSEGPTSKVGEAIRASLLAERLGSHTAWVNLFSIKPQTKNSFRAQNTSALERTPASRLSTRRMPDVAKEESSQDEARSYEGPLDFEIGKSFESDNANSLVNAYEFSHPDESDEQHFEFEREYEPLSELENIYPRLQLTEDMANFLSTVPREIEIFGHIKKCDFWLDLNDQNYRDLAIDSLIKYSKDENYVARNAVAVLVERHNLHNDNALFDLPDEIFDTPTLSLCLQEALTRNELSILELLKKEATGQRDLVTVFMAALGDEAARQEVQDILFSPNIDLPDTIILLRKVIKANRTSETPVLNDSEITSIVSGERAIFAMESLIDVLSGPYSISA